MTLGRYQSDYDDEEAGSEYYESSSNNSSLVTENDNNDKQQQQQEEEEEDGLGFSEYPTSVLSELERQGSCRQLDLIHPRHQLLASLPSFSSRELQLRHIFPHLPGMATVIFIIRTQLESLPESRDTTCV